MRFASLGSGSKGNGTLVAAGDTMLLVDCGFNRRETEQRLARLGVTPEQLDAILVTHEHGDHANGVASLSRHYEIPVYLSHGTAASGKLDNVYEQLLLNAGDNFVIDAIAVQSIPVPHDAREPTQFRLSSGGCCLGILTDLGSITPHVIEAYSGCTGLFLEFNHDLTLLQSGSYPAALKRRVGGDYGHLNNHQAAELLKVLDNSQLKLLAVGHLSEQNNSRAHAQAALAEVADCHSAEVFIACQQEGFDWLYLSEDLPVSASATC